MWTDEQVAILRELWPAGQTAARIGKLIDKSKNSVVGKAYRLGLATKSGVERVEERRVRKLLESQSQAPKFARKCAWPMGDPLDPSFHYCGDPTAPEKPYCESHCGIAYRPATEWEERLI